MKRIYRFNAETGSEGDASMAFLLGGKGANLAEMVNIGIPVPPGFTITTDVCKDFEAMPRDDLPLFMDSLMDEVVWEYGRLTEFLGYAPLVSVRSGAPVSMPGMMDTILNVGLVDDAMPFWKKKLGLRACLDSKRRLIQMMGSTAYGIDMGKFDFQLASVKKQFGCISDTDLTEQALDVLVMSYRKVFGGITQKPFPNTVREQLQAAVEAVFRSWMNPRAIEYRKINKIDPAMGTAVTVQAMVFGNTGDSSGTGVLFSRNAATGSKTILGEFLPNAQGEDVVAGIRTPLALHNMATMWPEQAAQLIAVTERLEHHYRDMMDIEFTIQDGKLWLLQCRIGKRSALAAFKIASQFVDENVITPGEAVRRVTAAQYKLVRRPRIPDSFKTPAHFVGNGASPGVAAGQIVFSSEDAVNCTEPCVLVTHETCPDDIAGMNMAQGILTATGGATSHAAVVARAMDKPCVVGCSELNIHGDGEGAPPCVIVDNAGYGSGCRVTIDGDTGRVWFGIDVPVEDASADPDVHRVCMWALEEGGYALKSASPEPEAGQQTFCIGDIWGDKPKLAQLLDNIAATLKPADVVFDITPPHDNFQSADTELLGCFGTDSFAPRDWAVKVLDGLLSGRPHLAGVTVVAYGSMADVVFSDKAGVNIAVTPKNVHDLLFSDKVVVTNEFVKTVIGSPEAMSLLMKALSLAGNSTGVLRQAVPLEYATFAALK